jgi:hypothetical protein
MSLQDGFSWPCYAVLHKIALAHIPEKAGRQAEMEFLDIKFDKRLESFAPCYSQSILLAADFKENDTLVWFYKSLQKIRETRKLKSIYE